MAMLKSILLIIALKTEVGREEDRKITAKDPGVLQGKGKQLSNRTCCCSAAQKGGYIQHKKCTNL